ncbi:unnamed protein product [Gordionus sp. m RMFG-2023]
MTVANFTVNERNSTCPHYSYTQKIRLLYSFPIIVLLISFIGIVANIIYILCSVSWDKDKILSKIFRTINRGKIRWVTNKLNFYALSQTSLINSKCNARKRGVQRFASKKGWADQEDTTTWVTLIRLLSLTDLMISVIIFSSMFTVYYVFKDSPLPVHFLSYSCRFHTNILNLLHGINNYIKVIMALVRWVAIKYPFRYKNCLRSRKIMGALTISVTMCCLVTTPEWRGMVLEKHLMGNLPIHYDCLIKNNSFVPAIMRMLVHDILPMVITLVAHISMIRIIYKNKHAITPLISTPRDNVSFIGIRAFKSTANMNNYPINAEHYESKILGKLTFLPLKLFNRVSRNLNTNKSKDAKNNRILLLIHLLNIEFCLITISYIIFTYNAITTHTPIYLYVMGYLFILNHCCEVFLLFIFDPNCKHHISTFLHYLKFQKREN